MKAELGCEMVRISFKGNSAKQCLEKKKRCAKRAVSKLPWLQMD